MMRALLTAREMEVAREVASGKSDKQIGAALGISWITARNQLASIRKKLGLSNRTQVALHYHGRLDAGEAGL